MATTASWVVTRFPDRRYFSEAIPLWRSYFSQICWVIKSSGTLHVNPGIAKALDIGKSFQKSKPSATTRNRADKRGHRRRGGRSKRQLWAPARRNGRGAQSGAAPPNKSLQRSVNQVLGRGRVVSAPWRRLNSAVRRHYLAQGAGVVLTRVHRRQRLRSGVRVLFPDHASAGDRATIPRSEQATGWMAEHRWGASAFHDRYAQQRPIA